MTLHADNRATLERWAAQERQRADIAIHRRRHLRWWHVRRRRALRTEADIHTALARLHDEALDRLEARHEGCAHRWTDTDLGLLCPTCGEVRN